MAIRRFRMEECDSAGSLRAAQWCRQLEIHVSIDLDKVVQDCIQLINNVDLMNLSFIFLSKHAGIADPDKSFRQLRKCCEDFPRFTGSDGLGRRSVCPVSRFEDKCCKHRRFRKHFPCCLYLWITAKLAFGENKELREYLCWFQLQIHRRSSGNQADI